MKILKVGVIGYGNIGSAVVNELKNNKNFELVGVFSRRNLPNTLPFEQIENFKDKIDLMFLCVGSQSDLEQVATRVIKNFNTIDCYDNHVRLKEYINAQNTLAIKHKKVALCALGWDPGIFSLMRALFESLGETAFTFWGKGLSQGHTQAIKNLPHVLDAVQFTIPNKKAIKDLKEGLKVDQGKNLHKRQCFVVCEAGYEKEIKKKIISMPDYFEGYNTTVKFLTQTELDNIKTFAHKGVVLTPGNKMQFNLNLESNPAFTARVLVSYASAVEKLIATKSYGAYTILDLPLNLILNKEKFNYV